MSTWENIRLIARAPLLLDRGEVWFGSKIECSLVVNSLLAG